MAPARKVDREAMELIATDVQGLVQEPVVTMFQIDATKVGEGLLCFSPTSNNGVPIKFGGVEYPPLPIAADGFKWTGDGTLPRPTLTLAARDLMFLSMVVNSGDLVGCPVLRLRTYAKYLDDGRTPNPQAMFRPENYVIERKSSQKRTLLQFELSVKMDQQGIMLPARQALRDTCTHRFRYWANGQWNYTGVTCPYTGAAMYEPNGNQTSDPTKAKCGKKLSDCKKHIGQYATLPFYGYPGLGRI